LSVILVLVSAVSFKYCGLYGFAFYGLAFAGTAWYLGKFPSYVGLIVVWLGLTLFLFEGEGFAVVRSDDALRMVMMMLSTVPIIQLVGHARHRVLETQGQLAVAERTNQNALLRLRELSHRVGNDLTTLSAVANLQSTKADPITQLALQSIRDRIHVFASLYRKLGIGPGQRSELDASAFIASLCEDFQKLQDGLRPIRILTQIGDVPMTPHRAMLVGIMLNESVTNAFKYAFPDDRSGTISILFDFEGDSICLSITDDGVGFDPASKGPTGMGQKIMQAMSSQLGGSYTLLREGNLTVSRACFPANQG
jgi:two-component sensor histidine kinase